MNTWLFFFKTCPPPSPARPVPRQINEVLDWNELNEHQNKTKNKAAFGISIRHICCKCGIYPFVTPESGSDMRAWAEVGVTHRHQGRGVKYQHVAGIFSTWWSRVDNAHVGRQEAWDPRSCDGWSWYWLDTGVFLSSPDNTTNCTRIS